MKKQRSISLPPYFQICRVGKVEGLHLPEIRLAVLALQSEQVNKDSAEKSEYKRVGRKRQR